MKTANFPRAVVMGVSSTPLSFHPTENDWLISITDFNNEDAKVIDGFGKILFEKFDDTTDYLDRKSITNEQAKEIAEFIDEAKLRNKNVYVNCHAGICRSGAIVEVLGLLGWDIQNQLVESPGRIPNSLVFDKVRKHFPSLKQSWDVEEDIWASAKGW